nr:hypothetical protein BaRGS_029161 [Batillaria attramentaria]
MASGYERQSEDRMWSCSDMVSDIKNRYFWFRLDGADLWLCSTSPEYDGMTRDMLFSPKQYDSDQFSVKLRQP